MFQLDIHQTAAILGVDQRTLRRWVELGLPRKENGDFSFPETFLWSLAYRHRNQHDIEIHLLSLLQQATRMPEQRVRALNHTQQWLRDFSGFELTQQTLDSLCGKAER